MAHAAKVAPLRPAAAEEKHDQAPALAALHPAL
eukprot:COSAG01_NODE_11278_length_1966_cov_22.505088_4_plen_32_part_01